MNSLYPGRKRRNIIWTTLAYAATALGLTMLVIILATLLWNGFGGLSLDVFTKNQAPPGVVGGLLNAIVGSIITTVIGLAIGAPLGILAGTYLAEYGSKGRLATIVRFINDILLSAPSIVIGLFIYEMLVVPFGHFSALAGGVALAVTRRSDHGSNHRGHAQSRAEYSARGRLCAWHAAFARHTPCSL